MIRKALPALLLAGTLVAAALAALGRPDLGRATSLLRGGDQSLDAAVALVNVIVWLIIAGAVVGASVVTLRAAATETAALNQRWVRGVAALVVGLVVLVAGSLHHVSTGYTSCCGDLAEAGQLVR